MTGKITAADMTAYLLYIGMLIASIKRIVEFTEQFEKGVTGVERFAEVLEVPSEVGITADKEPDVVEGNISFENISFFYDEEKGTVLNGVNLEVKKGENIAVVGPSGSGKTICAFYPS